MGSARIMEDDAVSGNTPHPSEQVDRVADAIQQCDPHRYVGHPGRYQEMARAALDAATPPPAETPNDLLMALEKLAKKYEQNFLGDHARGVRHAAHVVAAALLAAGVGSVGERDQPPKHEALDDNPAWGDPLGLMWKDGVGERDQ
jgi:hypothetical protein